MEIHLGANKLYSEQQTIDLQENILTLIGENGCGKSTLLRSIFTKFIDDREINIISFSSGQNELFTSLFNEYKRRNKRFTQKEENEIINSFYFNYDWVRTLIFFASIFKPEGNVRNFLVNNGYVKVNNLNDDISSVFNFTFRIRKDYKMRISRDYDLEASDRYVFGETKLVRKTYYHETIERIISVFGFDFYFDDGNYNSMRKRNLSLNFDKSKRIFRTNNMFQLFTFWALATTGWGSFFEISETRLRFENEMEFRNLSDGEYQLLSVYALIDLFDTPNTIFLLDEIDSHLYYKNLEKLWRILKNSTKGKIITTTHISDSILSNDYNNIRLIEHGKIESDLTLKALATRLSAVIGKDKYEFELAGRVQNIVLVDDEVDWLIFTKLVRKKISEEAFDKLKKMIPFKRKSNYDNANVHLGKSKLLFAQDFIEKYEGKEFQTKNLFLICDRDKFSLELILPNLDVNISDEFKHVKNNRKLKTHLKCWRRNEIENYLLSYTMLEEYGKLNELKNRIGGIQLSAGSNSDMISEICRMEAKDLLHPLYKPEPSGFNETLLDKIIEKIPANEISNDITTMYNYIIQYI